MAKKIYKRIGIRRDKNLGDLSDRKQGLNNLLDALVSTGTYISEDLDPLRNMHTEGLNAEQYQKIGGSRTQITNQNGSLSDLLPPVTYQNKLDKFQFFAGEPRLNGGNGLTAKYYDQENIDISTTNIFSGTPIKIDNFWEAGNFTYTGKITPLANNSNGGIEWDGFFIPTKTGPHTFSYATTASFTFEFEDIAESGTITERMRVGTDHVISTEDYPGATNDETGEFDPQVAFGATVTASGSTNTNILTLATAGNSTRIGIGMSVSGPNIVKDSKVYGVNQTTGVIELVHPDVTVPDAGTPAIQGGAISNQDITFYRNVGVLGSKSYTTPTLIAYQKYRIRYRYFIPRYEGPGPTETSSSGTFIAVDSSSLDRTANMDFLVPGDASGSNLRFENLYDIDYDFSDSVKGVFPKFMDNSILFGGGTVGSSSNSADYVKVTSSKKIDIKYVPPTSLSDITKATQTCLLTNGSPVISLNNTNGIEIGNYVFGENIPGGTLGTGTTRVIDIVINAFVILDQNATGGGSKSLTFIDHRGFVKRVTGTASSSSGELTISSGDTANLKTDMIVIARVGTTEMQQYTGITTNGSTNKVDIFPKQGFTNTSFYFYESKGLRNDSLIQYCKPDEARCLIVVGTVPAGENVITVESIPPDVVTGWTARGFQFSDRDINGNFNPTTITIDTPGTNQITLSRATINPLLDGEKVTVAAANRGDRTLCCPPLDTSPPFQATTEGLETSSQFPNLKLSSGDVKFNNLTVIKDITVDSANAETDVSTKYLDLNYDNGTPNGINYKILCE